jgi:hypothetical protein
MEVAVSHEVHWEPLTASVTLTMSETSQVWLRLQRCGVDQATITKMKLPPQFLQ